MFCLNIRNISIITVNGVGYCCIIDNISQSDAVHLVVNSVMIVVIYIIYAKETNIKYRVHNYSGYQIWLGVIDIKQRKTYKKDISNELVPLA